MNCLAILIKSRPTVANKIISAILNFNPLKQANSPMTPRLRVIVKSLERTTRALLKNINRHNPNGPLAAKIDAYLIRLNQSRSAVFADIQSLKRPAPSEATDGHNDAKRARLTGNTTRKYPPLPPPPNSVAQLFTLTDDLGLTAFDVNVLPVDMINTVTALTLRHVDQHALDEAITVIRARYAHLQKLEQPTPIPEIPLEGPTGIDDEDDYDPEYEPSNEGISSPIAAQALEQLIQPDIALGPFEMPKPLPLTSEDLVVLSEQTTRRFRELIDTTTAPSQRSSSQKLGLNRLAASSSDRDAWVTVMTRLATRAPFGLEALVAAVNTNGEDTSLIKVDESSNGSKPSLLATYVREELFRYVAQDFKSRLNVAISWLSEEWYNDKLATKSNPIATLPNYYAQTLRFLEYLVQFLDARDSKILIRFLSEIPAINKDMLESVRGLTADPERVNMCIMALQYLLLMRPPVRSMVIDTVEGIWRDESLGEAKAAAAKVLRKWRPGVLEEEAKNDAQGGANSEEGRKKTVNGMQAEAAGIKIESADPRKRSAATTPVVSTS